MLQLTDCEMAVRILTEEHINEHTQVRNKLLKGNAWWARSVHFSEDKEQLVKNCLVNIQDGPKVGVQCIVNYCIPAFDQPCMWHVV